MVNSVKVNNDGKCSTIKITMKKKMFYLGKSQLFIHYKDDEFQILSVHSIDDILSDDVPLLEFSFPPPLNSYIYPENVIVMKLCENKPQDLSCEELVEYCAKFKADMLYPKNQLAIYDVPLDEIIYEEDDHTDDDEDENEDSDVDLEDDIEDDEDFWEDEEPVVS